MRYEDWAKEITQAVQHEMLLGKVSRREYLIRRRLDERTNEYDDLTVRCAVYGPNTTPQISICIDRYRHGTINNIGELTAEELSMVATIRQVYQDWIDGTIKELPLKMPWQEKFSVAPHDIFR